ncbi:MAG: hypothetical protein WCW17_02080 [Patescibacteria group bacterium]
MNKEEFPSGPDYDFSQKKIEIPPDLQFHRPETIMNEPPEEERKSDLFLVPNRIAKQIKTLQTELKGDSETTPGAERILEIMEAYDQLKNERENIRHQIIDYLQDVNTTLDEQLDSTKQRRDKWLTAYYIEQDKPKDEQDQSRIKYLKEKFESARDFVDIIEKDYSSSTIFNE